ncbi:MAG: hypothetical protein ABIP06_13985, partial [Pyrinomonadaceae bacterium]
MSNLKNNKPNRNNPQFFIGLMILCLLFFVTVNGQVRKNSVASAQINPVLQTASDLIQTGKLAEAEAVLREQLAKTPKEFRVKILLGVALDQQLKFEEAEKVYRQ